MLPLEGSMGVIQLPDHIREIIDSQVSAGRVANAAEFLEDAVRRYANDLEAEDEVLVAAEAGIADIEAGRYRLISGPEDLARLRGSFSYELDKLAGQRGSGRS
jgi:Arc/MetJ-type ribon-helix-helix transcriptional regulator